MDGVKTNWHENTWYTENKDKSHVLTQNTSTWPANKSPVMCKTGHEHAANEKTHNEKQWKWKWKTQAACHTARDIIWMHAANKNMNCMQHHKTHMDRRARGLANSRPHTHTMRQNVERSPTRNRNSRHECRDPNITLQHETRHADERVHGSSVLETARSRENRTWWEYQGSVTKLWITLDRSDSTLTLWPIFNALVGFNALALTVHCPVHCPFDAVQLSSCPLSRKTPPKHNVSTSMFDGGDGLLGVIGSISPPPNTASWVDAVSLVPVCLGPPPPLERTKGPPENLQKLSIAYVTAASHPVLTVSSSSLAPPF